MKVILAVMNTTELVQAGTGFEPMTSGVVAVMGSNPTQT